MTHPRWRSADVLAEGSLGVNRRVSGFSTPVARGGKHVSGSFSTELPKKAPQTNFSDSALNLGRHGGKPGLGEQSGSTVFEMGNQEKAHATPHEALGAMAQPGGDAHPHSDDYIVTSTKRASTPSPGTRGHRLVQRANRCPVNPHVRRAPPTR